MAFAITSGVSSAPLTLDGETAYTNGTANVSTLKQIIFSGKGRDYQSFTYDAKATTNLIPMLGSLGHPVENNGYSDTNYGLRAAPSADRYANDFRVVVLWQYTEASTGSGGAFPFQKYVGIWSEKAQRFIQGEPVSGQGLVASQPQWLGSNGDFYVATCGDATFNASSSGGNAYGSTASSNENLIIRVYNYDKETNRITAKASVRYGDFYTRYTAVTGNSPTGSQLAIFAPSIVEVATDRYIIFYNVDDASVANRYGSYCFSASLSGGTFTAIDDLTLESAGSSTSLLARTVGVANPSASSMSVTIGGTDYFLYGWLGNNTGSRAFAVTADGSYTLTLAGSNLAGMAAVGQGSYCMSFEVFDPDTPTNRRGGFFYNAQNNTSNGNSEYVFWNGSTWARVTNYDLASVASWHWAGHPQNDDVRGVVHGYGYAAAFELTYAQVNTSTTNGTQKFGYTGSHDGSTYSTSKFGYTHVRYSQTSTDTFNTVDLTPSYTVRSIATSLNVSSTGNNIANVPGLVMLPCESDNSAAAAVQVDLPKTGIRIALAGSGQGNAFAQVCVYDRNTGRMIKSFPMGVSSLLGVGVRPADELVAFSINTTGMRMRICRFYYDGNDVTMEMIREHGGPALTSIAGCYSVWIDEYGYGQMAWYTNASTNGELQYTYSINGAEPVSQNFLTFSNSQTRTFNSSFCMNVGGVLYSYGWFNSPDDPTLVVSYPTAINTSTYSRTNHSKRDTEFLIGAAWSNHEAAGSVVCEHAHYGTHAAAIFHPNSNSSMYDSTDGSLAAPSGSAFLLMTPKGPTLLTATEFCNGWPITKASCAKLQGGYAVALQTRKSLHLILLDETGQVKNTEEFSAYPDYCGDGANNGAGSCMRTDLYRNWTAPDNSWAILGMANVDLHVSIGGPDVEDACSVSVTSGGVERFVVRDVRVKADETVVIDTSTPVPASGTVTVYGKNKQTEALLSIVENT